MILTLCTLLTTPSQIDFEAGRVRAFVQSARIGLEPGIVLPPYPEDREAPIIYRLVTNAEGFDEAGRRVYEFNHATVRLNVQNGRIETYHDGSDDTEPLHNPDGSLVPRRVTDADVTILAQRFYRAAGWPGDIVIDGVEDLHGNDERDVEVHYRPSAGGVPYFESFDGLMTINRRTGTLGTFYSPPRNLPAPPASVTPRGTAVQARLAALGFGVELRGESLIESPRKPFGLRIWFPPSNSIYNQTPISSRGYGSVVRAALADHRGLLVYYGWLLGGSRRSGVGVVVDAYTGEVLDRVEPAPDGSAGGAGGGSPVVSLGIPTSPRPWRIAVKGGAWSPPVQAALVSTPSKGFAEKKKTTLTDGKIALVATFDPKSGLLGIKGTGGKLQTYRPGPALANLLRRKTKGMSVASTPSTRQNPHAP